MLSLLQHIQGFVAMALDGGKDRAAEGAQGVPAPIFTERKSGQSLPETLMLWVDSVGGYRVCLAEEVVIGQPAEAGAGLPTGADVPILADLSSRHARIRRDGENYSIEALAEVRVDGRPVHGASWLADGSRIELGKSVRLLFRRPHPLSATARLELASRHRTEPPADAVLLWAETCILGPQAASHVVCRDWPRQVVLFRQEGRLFCHTPGTLEIDGVSLRGRGPLARNSRVRGDGFAFSLEPIGG
jgi:hypothetical protein